MSAVIREGDEIEIQDAFGNWHRSMALSDPHLNHEERPPGCNPWLVVRVPSISDSGWVNWPCDHIRPLNTTVPGDRAGGSL